eukprot:841325-Amorphochlora_amoeboformis.AAC.2
MASGVHTMQGRSVKPYFAFEKPSNTAELNPLILESVSPVTHRMVWVILAVYLPTDLSRTCMRT